MINTKYYIKSDVEILSDVGYNYSKIEGQNYEEKKYNDNSIYAYNRICSRKYNTCYKWKFEYWI